MRSKRLGKFSIPVKVWEDDHELALYIMSYMSLIPYRIECTHFKGSYQIAGYSVLFREVPEGEIIPEYTIEVNKESVSVTEIIK